MILDGHIHRMTASRERELFLEQLAEAGVSGGVVMSLPPATFGAIGETAPSEARLEDVLYWCRPSDELFPVFWIDPLEEDVLSQVARAVDEGVAGFKIICDRYYPGDERCLRALAAMAEADRPVLFHSGILWDGKPSGQYNRPVNFEALLDVPGLRFSMAHISWPWTDELIAVYGKFLNARAHRSEGVPELYVDTTPGTPPIYRRDVLTRLFTVGYDVADNVFFGSDCLAPGYNSQYAREWMERDRGILAEVGVEEQVVDRVFAGNLRRFLGLEEGDRERAIPTPGAG